MKNKNTWVPSKFVLRNGRLTASGNPEEVRAGSRLFAGIVASFYGTYIRQYVRGKLADLGCGKVPLFEAYRDYVSDNICVDWGNAQSQNRYLDFECDLTQKLPLQDGEFDTIILSDVLEHIPEPMGLWREMSRILAVGGKLLMNVPFYYPIHSAPHDYYRYTEHALRRFAEEAGFKVVLLKPMGGTPEILGVFFAQHLQLIPVFGGFFAMAVQYLAGSFVKTGIGKNLSEKTAKAVPLAYFMVAEKIEAARG